jgi:hypothetical protein
MKENWMAIIVGFVVVFVITLFSGLYLPKMGLIGPVIGGFIVVYLVEVSYRDGILYGGLPTSLAGLTSIPLVVFLSPNQTTLQLAGLKISAYTLTAIMGAISGFIIFLFIGIVCGIIAVAVQKKTDKKLVYALIAVVVIIFVYILSNVVHVGAILSRFSGV